ncbi:MAG TPA: beta-ketoacyl synthase N-terminal-like domain-containing protein, partial [Longimicrobiaceae bacterium]|nr:beta-ketoacyl synthase N-terminal-like domain-containing protein [Longimicrobiaceae bacterium]
MANRSEAVSLVELLRTRAEDAPSETSYLFLADGEAESERVTYAELERRARGIGALLREAGAAGERVLLLYPQGLDFVAAFYGCLFGGAVAVPAYPPRNDRGVPRILAILRDARPRVVLTTAALLGELRAWFGEAADARDLRWIATDAAPPAAADAWTDPGCGPDTLAFLQYTSGSTALPKGVMVSHGNLLHNLRLLQEGWGQPSTGSVVVSWLPLFHDMGLIGNVLEALHLGAPCVLMSPAAFLQRPFRWLDAVSRYGATLSGGPNFAYDLCVRRTTPEQRAGLDLSRWSAAFNGAEPVRGDTLERFYEAFAPCGLRREALHPGYGLAEATLVVSSGHGGAERPLLRAFDPAALEQGRLVVADEGAGRTLVGCGRVVGGQRVVIADPDTGAECPAGKVGEIWVAGPSVAGGYWERPEETERTFRAHLAGTGDGPFLRTGDLGFVHGGELFVAGRAKDVVIVRGRNHYPQDLELTAERAHAAIRPGCGAAFSVEVEGEERLVVAAELERRALGLDPAPVVDAVRRALAEEHELPPYAVVLLKTGAVPKTTSGKIQRRECRDRWLQGTLQAVHAWTEGAAPAHRADAPAPGAPGEDEVRAWLAARVAERASLPAALVDPREPFAVYGLDSAAAVGLSGELEEWLGRTLPPTLLYDHPSIERLARHLAGAEAPAAASAARGEGEAPTEPIAIVGIGCRFPGADGPEELWRVLRDGIDAVSEVPAGRWDVEALYDPDPKAPGKMSTRWGGFLRSVDGFDAAFFGIAPREAARMDPQQRILLEVAWEALEDAGQDPERLAGSATGVFVGISGSDYGQLQFGDPALGDAYAGTGGALSIAANRLSYALDLRGPSLAVDTACSSSLVALHLACRSLWSGECAQALAGGVNLLLSPGVTVTFSKAGFMAPDGRCRAFDARASGYVRAEGAGVVVLKPLSRALADGDPVYAVVRGTAVNQDGRSNGLTAPSRQAQEAVLRDAYRRAGVRPGEVQYVEAHGTGTPLGDPIEAAALGAVLGEGRPSGHPCLLGSVKTNLGHLEAAAGIAGVVKVALAMRERTLPASLHFESPNPEIPFDRLPLRVRTETGAWPAEPGAALAGVSSFGFGGTNAHVVLGEAPVRGAEPDAPDGPVLLPLSARAAAALADLA